MGLINCNKLLNVGVQRFDDEHCQLVGITNQLHEAIKTGQGNQAVLSTLQQLAEFAERHFRSEEALLEQHDYPELQEHHHAHQLILNRLAEIMTTFQDNPLPLQHTVMQFLLDWLINHTKGVDKLYGPFLNSKGVY